MFDRQQVERTERRYEGRTVERADTVARIATGAILGADTPERVELRLERSGLTHGEARRIIRSDGDPALPELVATIRQPMLGTLERLIGKSNLIDASFLTEGARVLRSVCRIEIVDGGLVVGYGTGVMVSPRLLLTNNHVLETPESASSSMAEFDYAVDDDGEPLESVRFTLDPDDLFVTDPALDYTLVAVAPESEGGRSLSDYDWVPLIERQGKVIKGEYVNIVQHPNGEPKQVALRENQVVDLLDDFLHYVTDTSPGSSGAPVFNDEWDLVALHHSGVPERDGDGNILAVDGSIWAEEMGEHRVRWEANEGVRVSRIVAHARGQRLPGAPGRLLTAALSMPPRPRGMSRPGARPEAARGDGSPRVVPPVVPSPTRPAGPAAPGADGTVTWTIPLEVSVRIGSPLMAGPGLGRTDEDQVSGPDAPDRHPAEEEPSGASSATRPGLFAVAGRQAGAQVEQALADLARARRQPYYDGDADETDRKAYYRGLPGNRSPATLFTALNQLLARTHTTQLRYQPSRHVYPVVDLRPNGMLRSIYTGEEYDPEAFIREDFRIEQERGTLLRERLGADSTLMASGAQEELDLLEASLPYNCEHVVPQSWYDKREPMRGDVHHLFACESRCNSFRSNIPYFEFAEFDEALRPGCGMTEGDRFEPSNGKGAVARATLYFLLRYPGEINRTAREYEADRLAVLLAWHDAEPPDEYERHRNAAIFAKSGNRNPLIDFPGWATEIDFAAGLG